MGYDEPRIVLTSLTLSAHHARCPGVANSVPRILGPAPVTHPPKDCDYSIYNVNPDSPCGPGVDDDDRLRRGTSDQEMMHAQEGGVEGVARLDRTSSGNTIRSVALFSDTSLQG